MQSFKVAQLNSADGRESMPILVMNGEDTVKPTDVKFEKSFKLAAVAVFGLLFLGLLSIVGVDKSAPSTPSPVVISNPYACLPAPTGVTEDDPAWRGTANDGRYCYGPMQPKSLVSVPR